MSAALAASTLAAKPSLARANKGATKALAARVVKAAPVRSVTTASLKSNVAAVSTAVSTAAMTVAAHPAMALVDDRMNGDGTGKILGVNDPVLGWVILGVFTTVWGIYAVSASGLGGGNGDDSGLSL